MDDLPDVMPDMFESTGALIITLNARCNELSRAVEHMAQNFMELRKQIQLQGIAKQSVVRLPVFPPSFLPVASEEDFSKLEQEAESQDFILAAVRYFGKKYPPDKFVDKGKTVLFQTMDSLFRRAFLTKCMWSRTTEEKTQKLNFRKFHHTLNLIYAVVINSDSTFTRELGIQTLRYIIARAKRRVGLVQRKPAQRPRGKLKLTTKQPDQIING